MYVFNARPGRVSSWLSAFAARPTSNAPDTRRVASRPIAGMPSSFSTPVVRPLRRCARKPRSGPLQRSSTSPTAAIAATAGPPITPTFHPTSGSRRAPQAAEVDALRAAGVEDVAQLAGAMDEAAQVPAGGAVTKRELELAGREPRARGVDRHPDFAAEAGREGEARRPRRRGERALSG